MPSHNVPLHRSLIVRLLATSVLVAIGAIAATAWLTAQTTTAAIKQQQGRSISDDAMIYDALLGYAATHPNWDGVAGKVKDLSRRTGHRVTLLTVDRETIADSAPTGPALRSALPSAQLNPLHVGTDVAGAPSRTSAIDPRAVGPYKLTVTERRELERLADEALRCLTKDARVRVIRNPNGRSVVTPDSTSTGCIPLALRQPVATEARALRTLTGLVDTCMPRKVSPYVEINQFFEVVLRRSLPRWVDVDEINNCIVSARQQQLRKYVAPAALLFVTDVERGTTKPSISLTRKNVFRIAAGTGLVLAVAIAVTVVVGLRLVRPLRRLTEAARRPIEEQQHVTVGTRDEIGYLAIALNDLSDRREQVEEQRKAMVSDVAHELRTPLTNIRSWIEAAQDGMTPTDAQLLELLHDETVLLQHVVDDLRDLAAADAGTLRLYPEFRFVNDVLSQVIDAHLGVAEERGVELSTNFTADPQMSIDPVRLRQLIGNLVSNAIRHTDRGGLVMLRTAITDEHLVIDVADTGMGIESANLEKVFDRFWRADTSRSRSTGGSGLGLAIARKLVEAHDGDIAVTSRIDVGSTFTVRLPMSRQAPAVVSG